MPRQPDPPANFADAVRSMQDVEPLERTNSTAPPPPTPARARSNVGGADVSAQQASAQGLARDANAGTRATRRQLRHLRAGKIRPQQTVDLHGLTQDEAHQRLCNAVARAVSAGARCVLVIHGRGQHSEGGRAVLRQALDDWVAQPPLADCVTGCCLAQARDGGPGASYLLLRH